MAKKTGKRRTAKVFTAGRSQQMRLPKESRLVGDEVTIEREGERVILAPLPCSWSEYFAHSQRFSDDYPEDIADAPAQEREKS